MAEQPVVRHDVLTGKIIGACYDVVNELGRGFLESVYQQALGLVLREQGLTVELEAPIQVKFRGECVGRFYADLLVEEKVVVELKAVTKTAPEHRAQLINYLNSSGMDVGLLINFGSPRLDVNRCWRSK